MIFDLQVRWTGVTTSNGTSPFVEEMYDRIKDTLNEYDMLLNHWPEYTLTLETVSMKICRCLFGIVWWERVFDTLYAGPLLGHRRCWDCCGCGSGEAVCGCLGSTEGCYGNKEIFPSVHAKADTTEIHNIVQRSKPGTYPLIWSTEHVCDCK